MSDLRTWRKVAGHTLEQAATLLGTSTGSLSRIERGEQWPDPEFFRRVVDVTNGEVTPNDFFGLPEKAVDRSAA
jgi:transcriptional regulator with XRE-family HTH domain